MKKVSERILSKTGNKQHGPLTIGITILVIAVLAVAAADRVWYPTNASYTFSPCPGLTVTSTATTGIWNCPNQLTSFSITFAAGQAVTITGTWATGYGTLGCVPQNGQPCAVPQIASLQDYLHVNIEGGMWFVIQWKEPARAQLMNGQTITVNGTLESITYPLNPGATFPIFHLNNQTGKSDLLQPQPSFEIMDAVLE